MHFLKVQPKLIQTAFIEHLMIFVDISRCYDLRKGLIEQIFVELVQDQQVWRAFDQMAAVCILLQDLMILNLNILNLLMDFLELATRHNLEVKLLIEPKFGKIRQEFDFAWILVLINCQYWHILIKYYRSATNMQDTSLPKMYKLG